ncbi:protein FAM161A isoform X3 [Melanerpes formicivorus]|uniref:protein FAM161A isoform X3 n=1 Tax=Melanerpes formicivorus TaxID=211600 RepID=UPI00358FC0EE
MEAAHRAARLAASCLCTPLDPRTRAPAALYERGPPPAAAQDSFDLDTNTNREKTRALNGDSDKWIDLSKMYNSNQEYYLKLEELKNAHLETMAKLESMYQNKLYLKGVQPLDKKSADPNACCRPTWEKSSYQPLNLYKSFSDSDLSDPLRSSLSDGSDRELAFEESSSETGSSAFAKERIEKMWDGFSVEDYITHIKHSFPSSPVVRMIGKKQKAWSPKVTMPKPFQMTIREARKKEQNIKSKSQIEMENNLLKKQLEEEAECQKKFRANPVPAAVFLPLYHEIVQQNEERRRSVKERSKLKLLASQKPFKFIEREKQRNEIRKMQLKELSAPEKKKMFRAKPVPKYIYSPSVKDKLKEEELYREIRIRMRAEELLRNSSLPNSRLALTNANKKNKHKCIDPKETEHKPKTKSSVPDFDLLHQKTQEQLQQRKRVKHLTVCEPFDLRTPYIPSNKGKILKDIQEDEEKLKETRWPYTSLRCKTERRHSNINSHLSGSGDFKSPKSTESTRRRQQAVRVIMDKVEERDYFEEAADSSPWSEQSCEEKEEEEGEKRKGAKTSSPDGPSTELEDEEEARDSPHIDQPCHAGKAGSSSSSHQHHEEENEEEEEEEEAKAGLSLGHSQDKEEDNDWSRPSSQSNQSHEYEETGQSYPEAEDAFRYEDEEYESDDSEEKPSSDEAD